MAEPVVDLLEAVDVHEQRRHRHVQAPGAGEDLLGPVEDQASVRQARQGIVKGPVFELVGLLPDQPPSLLTRARERTVEQESEDRHDQAERQSEEALRVG